MRRKKKVKAPDDIFELAPGVSTRPYIENTKREYDISLLLKAVIVILLTIGSIGSYLSAVDITYQKPLFFAAVIIQAFIFVIFYRSKKWENAGALLFFLFFLVAVVLLHAIINSGFYAVVNQTIDRVSFYFNTSGMREYTERIQNRYLTVTVFAITIGVVLEFFLFSNVTRRAAYIWCTILTVTVNLVMLYVQRDSSPVYMLMLVLGLALTVIIRCGGHYQLYWNKSGYAKTKHGITYTVDSKMLTQVLALTTAAVVVIMAGTGAAADINTFDSNQPKSAMKASNEDVVKNAFMLGFDGLLNRYPSKGGLNSGRLGGVSSVTQDFQPDLQITYVPYSQDTVYIRNYIGEKYNPIQNYWSASQDELDAGTASEASSLKNSYEKNGSGARAVMTIENVGGDIRPYQPYYTTDGNSDLELNKSETVTFYPLLNESDLSVPDRTLDSGYLEVPAQDRTAIEQFCKDAGLSSDMDADTIMNTLRSYFQKNYPYTLRPGATPRDQDFVAYFLSTNKKGYCAHFASSAVLILRYLGIPARYCEGYAVSMDNVANNAEVQDNLSYDSFYEGQNMLGRSAVVKVAATDANAHAWVEVYTKGHGWEVKEFTPASSESNNGGGLLSNLMNLFTGGGNSNDTTQQESVNNGATGIESLSLGGLRTFFLIILLIIIAPVLIFAANRLLKYLKYRKAFQNAGTSDRLILFYQRKTDRLRRKDPAFRKCVNYEQQASYMYPSIGEDIRERIVEILTRAGFSGKDISQSDYDFVVSYLIQKLH